jgi:hypothetical protein
VETRTRRSRSPGRRRPKPHLVSPSSMNPQGPSGGRAHSISTRGPTQTDSPAAASLRCTGAHTAHTAHTRTAQTTSFRARCRVGPKDEPCHSIGLLPLEGLQSKVCTSCMRMQRDSITVGGVTTRLPCQGRRAAPPPIHAYSSRVRLPLSQPLSITRMYQRSVYQRVCKRRTIIDVVVCDASGESPHGHSGIGAAVPGISGKSPMLDAAKASP